ncbi:MAG: DUF3108 domain-containing protein [Bradyrhizobiaceae bacterium]|nr:MAG: DUF3108 domain-containing protein [Bradyrhizobiaceae bacterium]
MQVSGWLRHLGSGALLALAAAGPADAQGRLEARYAASLAGIPVGSGVWVIEITDTEYMAAASGRASGMLKLFTSGHGSSGARGSVSQGRLVPKSYASTITADRETDEVRMALNAGTVKDLVAEPPLSPSPDRVPVTEAHRKGVVDPMTAALMPVAGTGDPLSPDACKRKLSVFDGRQRTDIELVYKRMEQVKAQKGYAGPVVVCTPLYQPVAGHRPNRAAIQYLMKTREMEIWLAPIAGTRVLVPFRFSVPTPFGSGVLQATQFVTAAQAKPIPAATAKTQ